jgi:tetratricopeptide (TPR) repeat protein
MRSFALILVLLAFIGVESACSSKPDTNAEANTPANTETVKESTFANITDANAALAEGNRLLDDNQTDLAIDAFKRAVEIDPGLAEAHFKLGIAYALIEAEMVQTGVDANANTDSESKKAAPKSNSQKEFEKAVAAYKKLLATNPKDDVAQFNLGRAYNKLNQDDDAEEAFRAAVKLKPDDTEYQTELGAILIKLAKYHEAIPPLKKALELDAENLRADKLLDDAEAGAKRVDFAQPDKEAKRSNSNSSSNSNTAASNANMSGSSNASRKPSEANSKPRIEDPKDKHPEKTPAKTPNRRP